MKIVYNNLEKYPWQVVNDTTVNPVPMTSVSTQLVNGHLGVTMAGPQYGGALIACKLPTPVIPGTTQFPYSGLDFEAFVDDDSMSLLRCFESDLKAVWNAAPAGQSIPNCMDGSFQVNLAEGGMCQIDNAVPTWVDTGIKSVPAWLDNSVQQVPILTPNAWSGFSLRHSIDGSNFSFLSINSEPIPVTLRPLPLLNTNWASVLAVQFQLVLQVAGTVTVRYRNVTLTVSDSPF